MGISDDEIKETVMSPGKEKFQHVAPDISSLATPASIMSCERVFSFANALYDRRSYNLETFSVIMMIRCHDQQEKKVINMKILFNTKNGMKNLIEFIKTDKITTRKWLLEILTEEDENGGGWGEIDQEIN